MKCVSNHKNAISLAGQKMATMTGAVLARFVAQVRGVAFYSLSVCGSRVGDCVEFVRRPDNPYDSNCVDVRIVRRGRSLLLGHFEGYIERNTENAIQRAIGIQVFIKAATTWGYGILQALQMAADVTGASTRSVRKWANAFIESVVGISPDAVTDEAITDLLLFESGRTKASWQRSLINDEEFRLKAREYVRSRAHRRGEPNLTANMFLGWIQEIYHVDVCAETARLWLHNLGFSQTHHHKGMYFDGHERDDIVQYRHKFVQKLDDLDRRCEYGNHPPQLLENEKPIVIVHHDESTFYANADQSSYWGDDTIQALKQKSLGQAIMVSDFIEESTNDYLKHDGDQARLLLETQSDGYFNNDKLLEQVDGAINIFEKKFPDSQALFLFDNAPSHCKVSDDALNAERMNVGPGGKQPIFRDTVFDGKPQTMVLADGRAKGMKIVLQERGINTDGMVALKMREILNQYEDFSNKKTILEEMIEARGHLCMYYPKFHCELNPMERCWCHAKKHTRAHANGSIVRLRKIVPESLDMYSCSQELIMKFMRKARDYLRAYREGSTCWNVDEKVKSYKSHRRVFDTDK